MCLLPRDRLSHTSLTMGTRSRIGKQLADGSILSVYCHYDGYPEFNGRVLRDYFSTNDKVSDLIDGGDMSCTWTCLLYTSPSPRDQRGSRMPSSA